MTLQFSGERVFLINGLESLTICVKNTLVKGKTVRFLEGNLKEYLPELGGRKRFLKQNTNTATIKKIN